MKFWSAIVMLLSLVSSSSCHKRIITSRTSMYNAQTSLLVDEHRNIKPPVIEIMKLTGLAAKTTLHDVIVLTQKAWLRPAGLERVHLTEQFSPIAHDLLHYFDQLGLVKEIMPTRKTYDYVLLLGSMYDCFKSRLHFLEQLTASGLRFKHLALLGSHRILERQYEIEPMMAENSFATVPLTEIEMMDALFMQSSLKHLDEKSIIRVASPMNVIEEKRVIRANTLDTVNDFLRLNKKPGFVLVISRNPYLLRQHLVVSKALGNSWHVETAGFGASPDYPTAVYLDELGRTLFELDHQLSDDKAITQ